MIEITAKDKCSGCHACANACPKNCIRMLSDEEGFQYPQVDKDICINCGLCEKVCPIIHKWKPDESSSTAAMAVINQNEEIRLKSSSGGVFTLIAEEVINQGGVVYGAAFAEDFRSVQHICVDNSSDLEKLRGSKYVQSKITDTYKQAEEFLKQGRIVLFSGTPCQIGGLYSYLGSEYENLLTQDIICHGVPSPLVWEKYTEYRTKIDGSEVHKISFRNKNTGWKNFSMQFEYQNNTGYIMSLSQDPFMKAFLNNLCLRPSCYNCNFKTKIRQSDFTLADLWGAEHIFPNMNDDKGISLVLVNSEKGMDVFKRIRHFVKSECVDLDLALKYNSSMTASVQLPSARAKFMSAVQTANFDKLEKDFLRVSTLCRLKRKIKTVVHRPVKK